MSKNKKQKTQKPVKTAASRALFSSFYEKNRLNLAFAVVLQTMTAATGAVISWILGAVMDIIASGSGDGLGRIAIVTAVFLPAIFIIEALAQRTKAFFVHRGIKQYKNTAFSLLAKKGIGTFAHENTGGYLSAFTNDATSIEDNYLNRTVLIVYYVFSFVISLGMMLYYSPLMTLIVIGLSIIPIIVTIVMGGGLKKREKKVSDRNEAFTSRVKDLLGGFSVIKAFKAEKQAKALFASENGETEEAKCSRRSFVGMINALSASAGGVVQFGIFLIGAIFAMRGDITAGTVLIFINLCSFVLQPVQAVPEYIASRNAAKALVYKLADRLDDNQTGAGGEAITSLKDGIELNSLGFAYEEDKPVLSNLSYHFENGKKYALVGFSGSGKTTLLNLLMGTYGDYIGSVKVGGVEMKTADMNSLYESVSLINQSVFLFDDTIRNNITMFSEFPKEAVDSAIRRAGLENVIAERGEGYLCGENGANLSGGERQRISIARALIKNASVLLVDEATSALDNETASLVSNEILNLSGITGIVVTHRLEANLLKKYDAILMLKNGSLAEVGSFDELMESKGQFYSLFTVQ
ncbi:MAG: ABC transporter ATP-binding protein [Clostridia bacterium]|nr:ABC transporter ATP-binding protein [Clostridia bacterium]